MYNAEQKERFLKEYSTSVSVRSYAVRLFNKIEPYEAERGADVCTFGMEDLQTAYDSVGGIRNKSRDLPRSILREYAKWCMQNGISGATDTAFKLDRVGTERIRLTTVRNPRHLQAWLDMICVPESENNIDNYVRAYCWLAYSGMSNEAALKVRTGDVSFQSMTVRSDGVDYPIYREALSCMWNCVELKQFKMFHPTISGGFYKDRVPGDLLLRGCKGMPTGETMRVEISRRKKKIPPDSDMKLELSFNRIWLSGVFYRMWEDEQAGLPVDFRSIAELDLAGKNYKLDQSRLTMNAKRNELARDYRDDYERWKQTLII